MPENVPFFDDSRYGGIGRDQYASLEDDRFHHTDRTVEVDSYENEKFRDQNLSWDMERPENFRNQMQDVHHHRNGANYEKSRVSVRDRLGSEPRYDSKGPLRNDGFSKPDHKHVNIHQGKFGEQMEVKERLGLKHGQHVVENVSDFGNVDHRKNDNFNDGIERTVSYQHDYLNSEFYDRDKRCSKDDSYVSDHTSYQKMNKKSRWSPATEIVNQERKVELYDLKPTQTSSRRDRSKVSTLEHKTDTRGRYRHSSSLSPKRRKFDHNAHGLQNGKQGQGHEKSRNIAGKNADHLKGQDRNVKVVPEKVVNQSQKGGNSLDHDYRTKEKMSPSWKQKQEHEKISDMDRVNRTLAHASQSSYVAKTDKISPGRTRHETPIGSSSSGDQAISGSENKMDSQPTSPDVISFQKNQIKTLSSILEVLQNKINADENKKKEEEKRKADEMKLKNEAMETAKRINEKASKIIQEQVPGESARQKVVNDLDPTFKPLLDKMTPRMTKTGAPISSLLDGMDHLSKLTVEEKVKLAATLPRLAEVADPNKMSLADKIRLLRFIMDTKSQDENPIKIVEESIRGCGLGLTLKYEAHEIKCVAGRPAFTGTLHLSDAFLARSVGFTKKEIKHNIYEQALNLLKNKTAAEIVAMKDPGIDELRYAAVIKFLDKWVSLIEEKHKKSEHLESESQETKFKKLIQYIKDNKNSCLSPVTFLHKAIESSQCSLKSHYYTKRVNLPIGELFFFHKGVLLIDDIVIGIGTGHKGKTVKPAAYCNAIETLKRKSVKHILTGIRPLKDDVLPPIFVDREKFKISSKKRMEYLVKDLKESQMEDHQEAINKAAKESWLTPLCVYKIPKNERQKRWIHCEFFINQLLVGEGEGEQMKDAELEAYNSAWRLLRNVSVESMFENNRKMNLADFSDPTIVDVQLKVNFQSVSNTTDCNLAALKRLKFDLNQEGKTKEGLVILEHEEWSLDRKGQAFSILNHSATQNGMFLHWLIQPEGKLFKGKSRCAFNLQGDCVGEATAADRNGAKNLAAADALFRLYDSHDVVKTPTLSENHITRWDDSKLWTEYWEIKEQAMKLAKEESGGEGVL
ncbi:hypothetical protein KUTeg_015254 [Tegillarca granosa]|uniref:DRBM domain-containing protein n=1 Tax=Tegillarca granosa TaxID=220873 RepID=A0ABQ9EUU4_TEGGR|nr:hypothetical protein KUTeg_015254 [Tegillarca granosa]